jgi:erythromycin esterase
MQMLVHSLLGIWRVQGNCSMMDYFRNHQIDLAGIDPNNTALPFDRKQLNLILRNPDLSQRLSELDSLFLYKFSIPKERLYWKKEIVSEKHLDSVAAALKKAFQITRSEISKLAYLDNKQKNIFIKAIESQIECLSVSNDPKNKRFYVILHERDSLMAKNLEYLADTLYANRKIIVWAHNAHINKIENERINAGASIGCYLKNPIKEKSLVIGLYATSGQYGIGMKSCNTIKYKKHSFETLYGNFKNKALFIESKNIENKMYRNGIPNNFPANVSKMFDGVILIRDVSCSKLIKYNKDFICE